jgi:mono/diheme cytochrome c family protein
VSRPAALTGLLALLAAPAAAAPPPQEDYTLNCSGCHHLDGAGVPGVVPPLTELGPLLATPAGRAYVVRVPGVAQAPLDDERLAELLNWVSRELSRVEPSPRFAAEEVRALREHPLRDPLAARAAVLGRRAD